MVEQAVTQPAFMRSPSLSLVPFIETLAINNGIMVEVGCYAGESTEQFAQSGKFSRIFAVDPWENWESKDHMGDNMAEIERHFDDRMSAYPFVVKMKRPSCEAAELFQIMSLDLVYIDAFHDYDNVKADILAWLPKVMQGGIISGHDLSKQWPGVIRAVREIFGRVDRLFPDTSWVVKKNHKGDTG